MEIRRSIRIKKYTNAKKKWLEEKCGEIEELQKRNKTREMQTKMAEEG